MFPVMRPLGTINGVWSQPCCPAASVATMRRNWLMLVAWKATDGTVTSHEVAVGGRLSASTITLGEKTSKLDVERESRMRWLATVVLLDTFQRRISFSPVSATNSGGRIIVVIPYQLKLKGTLPTTGGLSGIEGGAVRKGWNVIGPVMGSPWPPGFWGVVGPVGSPQKLSWAGTAALAWFSMAVPLSSNQLPSKLGALATRLPWGVDCAPVVLSKKRVLLRVRIPNVFVFTPIPLFWISEFEI